MNPEISMILVVVGLVTAVVAEIGIYRHRCRRDEEP